MAPEPNPMIGHVAETTLISAAIVVPGFWDAVDRLPDPDDFDNGQLAALWGAVLAAKRRGKVTRSAVVMHLREAQFDEQSCFVLLQHVRTEFLTIGDAKDSARFMLDRRMKKQVNTLCAETIGEIATTSNIRELAERHERGIADLVLSHEGASAWSPGFAADASADILKPGGDTIRIPSGWSEIDDKVRGWPRSKLSLIAGRPSMGKSLFGVCAAHKLAARGYGVGFVSLEMTRNEIWLRLAADICYRGFNSPEYEAVQAGVASPAHVRSMEEAMDVVRGLPIAVDDRGGLKVAEMHRWARRLDRHYRDHGSSLDALFIDYLQLAKPDKDRRGNRVQEVTDISSDLVAMAKDLGVALIAMSQLSRAPEQRGNPRPTLSDLRDSGSLEQDADMVGMLFRPAYYFERKAKEEELTPEEIAEARRSKNFLDIDWQKNRNGKTGIARMMCVAGSNAVRDLAPFADARAA